MRRYRLIDFIWIFSLLLSASASPAFAFSFDEIIEKGEISIAVYRDYFPFSYRKDGRLMGVDVDVAHYIAKKMEVRLNLIEQTADENVEDDLRNAIWKGHYLGGQVADVMLHVPYDRDFSLKNNQVFFFGPYYQERVGLAWNPEIVGEQATIAVFRFDKIGVELDTIADFYLVSALGGALLKNVVHFPNPRAVTDALIGGEIAGAAGPLTQLEAGLKEHREAFRTAMVPMRGLKSHWLLGAAVKHTYRQLGYFVGDILSQMVGDGIMKEIFNNHGIKYNPPPDELLGSTAQ
ncbi:MAG: transporter substrate-binding domain-containing protein [Rhodospirillaceae bacterium]|jgi:ABC-type amino acid transport substrate-binding protein|nr:transporter substrate-binding domain-containing protein [Rhodospirillaceae bacterium]